VFVASAAVLDILDDRFHETGSNGTGRLDPAIAIYEQELARLEAEDEQDDASP
jgi:hypothetical protein